MDKRTELSDHLQQNSFLLYIKILLCTFTSLCIINPYSPSGKHLKLIADEGRLLYIKWNFHSDWEQFDGPVSVIGTLDSGFFGRTYYRQLIMNDFVVDKTENI